MMMANQTVAFLCRLQEATQLVIGGWLALTLA
jgi:hypothetical protein